MNLIDSIVEMISPAKAYERACWRATLEEMRGYDAGSHGRLNAAWRTINGSAAEIDSVSRDTIRARARDLERNSDIAQSILSAYRRNVVGKGYTLQAQTGDEGLNKQIETAWAKWCKARHCDITGDQSLTQMLRMIVDRKRVDGGILIRKCYTRGNAVPLQLQLLEVDELDPAWSSPKHKGNTVVGGIEYDKYRRAVGYHIRQYGTDGFQMAQPEYVPADRMIFLWSKHRPSQIREISDLAPTITRIRDTNEFITAVSVKERIAACMGVLIKKAIPSGGLGRNSVSLGGQIDYAGKKLTPGMILEMNAGDDATIINPSGTATDAGAFLKTQQALIGAGQGLSYESTSRDMSQSNYSSARQGSIEDSLTFEEDREMILQLLDEIYETWLISAVLAGVINIPDFWADKERWFTHRWATHPKPWVDPAKEASANKTAISTMQKSFKDIAAENGKDWRTMLDDIAETADYARARGIDLGGVLYGQSFTAADAEE